MKPTQKHSARIAYNQLAPKAFEGLVNLSVAIHKGLLDQRLQELVFLRVSQINRCGFCIDMHWHNLIKQDIAPRHINAVAGWREADYFTERERAALHWAETVTAIPNRDPSDDDFAQLRAHFSDAEIAELGFAIASITAWNLLNVSFRNPIPEQPWQ